ncbi:BLUE COPPER PROTEIN [Salix purpurea]|uniref:BLUE COPPER PROTEIN n=1 Tax=Salix purpurea TaxID=77065 RepID=A0A9Q0UKZ0_SALPP|nr:BLUE COPPER PROTEIN [Salix purpurea]
MARVYGMALLAAISVAYLIHSSSAQTTFTVGDTTGWTVPQNVGRKMLVVPLTGGARDIPKTTGEIGRGVDKNSATSLGFAGLTTFLSIFVALCY